MFNFFKYQLTIIALLLFPFYRANDKNRPGNDEDCLNYVLIQGSSNINQFEFVNYDPEIDPYQNLPGKEENYRNIQIPVKDFNSPNNRMLNDFFKMVNVSEYPFIKIDIEPREKADFDETTGLTNFKTRISIAGNTNTFTIPCHIGFCGSSEMVLEGDLEIELSDFDIKPPKKLFGTVKVNDEVFITFAFKYDVKKT